MVEQAERAALSRRPAHAAHSRHRHLRDAGVPAPVARLRRGGEGRRQAGRTDRRRGLQPLRIARDARQSLWSDRARHARTDATREMRRTTMNQAAKVQDAKGPLVWLDMDQKALDDAYDQLVYAPNRDQVHKRNMFNSDRVRARLGAPKRHRLWAEADGAARSVRDRQAERADQRVHPRRRLADAHGQGLRLHGRGLCARRRALDRARLRRRRGHQGRSAADGRSGAARRRLGLQERQELRRRSEPHLRVRPVVRRASRRLRRDHRLEGLRRARTTS